MVFSIIIPCRDESEIIEHTIEKLIEELKDYKIEIIIVDDFSLDDTLIKAENFKKRHSFLKVLNNKKKGLGNAIDLGIMNSSGDYILIYMADMSDDTEDVKKYFKICFENKDISAVFGSRFLKSSRLIDYPKKKLVLNRIFNIFLKLLYISDYNDFTNSFKIYKKTDLLKLRPLVSENFNIFLEIPLKIIGRKFKYHITSVNWKNRTKGKAKFKIKELSSMYIFTLIYCFIEKILINKKN